MSYYVENSSIFETDIDKKANQDGKLPSIINLINLHIDSINPLKEI